MRILWRAAAATGLVALLSACMTPYQPKGMTGGYTDQKLDEDTYLVSFQGNGNTPSGVVAKYFLYRCAELTLERGYVYFELFAPERDQQSLESDPEGDPFVKTASHSAVPPIIYVPTQPVPFWRYRAIVRMYPEDILLGAPTLFSAREIAGTLGSEVRSGNPSPVLPAKFRSVQGKFPIMPVRQKAPASAAPPSSGGPVKLEDLEDLLPKK